MTSVPPPTKAAKRVIIRAHEYHYDNYQIIVQDWFQSSGYSQKGEMYDWTLYHYVHLGGLNGGRFHLVIDMKKHHCHSPLRTANMPLEVYRLRKPVGKAS
jgi:hypothetical protein